MLDKQWAELRSKVYTMSTTVRSDKNKHADDATAKLLVHIEDNFKRI